MKKTIRRREFIALLGGASVAGWPRVSRAQQPAIPVVGFLHQGAREPNLDFVASFLQGLREHGFVDGKTMRAEFRWADNRYERLPELAADLVRQKVAVMSATYVPAALAAKSATSTIPIVFVTGTDPVETKLVASLSRPGGNVTGVHQLMQELAAKRLELLRELAPGDNAVAILANPTNPGSMASVKEAAAAARTIGQRIEVLNVSNDDELGAVLAALAQSRPAGLIVPPDGFLQDRRIRVASAAVSLRLPAVYYERMWADAGGLMSYGPDNRGGYRQAGVYAGRILKGESPADLPIVQPTKFELIINLKAARAIGLAIPEAFLLRADEMIE